MGSATAARTRAVARISTARAHVVIQQGTAIDATTALPIVRRGSIAAAAAARVQVYALDARTSPRTHHTRVRAPSIQTTADGDATQHTFTAVANAAAARISHAARIITALVHAITRAATATSATAARPTVPRANTVVAAAVRAQAHVVAAQMHLRTHTTPVRARSTRTIAAGNATQITIPAVGSATAARISHVARISTARDHAVTRKATATSVTTVRRTVRVGSIVTAAAVRVWGNVRHVRYLRIRSTHRRAMSTKITVGGSANSGMPRMATRAKSAETARRTLTAMEDISKLANVHASRPRNVRRARKRRTAAISISGTSVTNISAETGTGGRDEASLAQGGDHHPDLHHRPPRSSICGKAMASC